MEGYSLNVHTYSCFHAFESLALTIFRHGFSPSTPPIEPLATPSRKKLLSPEFAGLVTDNTLHKLVDPSIEPGFTDPRHCLVVWGRPPSHIRSLATEIQQKLLTLTPRKYFKQSFYRSCILSRLKNDLAANAVQTYGSCLWRTCTSRSWRSSIL